MRLRASSTKGSYESLTGRLELLVSRKFKFRNWPIARVQQYVRKAVIQRLLLAESTVLIDLFHQFSKLGLCFVVSHLTGAGGFMAAAAILQHQCANIGF